MVQLKSSKVRGIIKQIKEQYPLLAGDEGKEVYEDIFPAEKKPRRSLPRRATAPTRTGAHRTD